MTEVAVIRAFSRDPADLFQPQEEEDGREQRRGAAARQAQPVMYHRVALRTPLSLSDARKEELIHTASVDWVRGRVSMYASRDDVMNHVPTYFSDDPSLLPSAPPEHADVYVRETFALFLRGHSVFHPGCRCEPSRWFTRRRAAVLGLPWRPFTLMLMAEERCTVGVSGEARSLREVALELGVQALGGGVQVNLGGSASPATVPLLQILIRLAGFKYEADDAVLWLDKCCIPRSISCGADVIQAARVLAPRPYVHTPDQYDIVSRQALQKEIDALARARRIRVLHADTEGAWAIFWNGDALHLEPVGWDDRASQAPIAMLREAWHTHAPRKLLPLQPQQADAAAVKRRRR